MGDLGPVRPKRRARPLLRFFLLTPTNDKYKPTGLRELGSYLKLLQVTDCPVMGISDVVGGVGMKLSFSAFNHRLKVVNDLNKYRNRHCNSMRLGPCTDEMKNSLECQKSCSSPSFPCSALTQENTVGIIGGVSVLSTLIFLEKLVWSSTRKGGESVPFIVCSDPLLKQEAHKQGLMINNNENSTWPGFDQKQLVRNLISKRVFLEEGGARCIVMPCHVSHVWYSEISQGCALPFLHVAECVATELKEARFKPLEVGSRVKIGVIATDATLMTEVYQKRLQNQGFEVVLPDRATMDHIINPAIKSLNRKDKEGACNLLRIAIQVLLVRAVNTVILASDELQGLLPHDDPLCKKCIDPMDSLVRSAVRWAKSVKVRKRYLNDGS